MDDRINMRTFDNTAYARTTSLIATRKFRNLAHSQGVGVDNPQIP